MFTFILTWGSKHRPERYSCWDTLPGCHQEIWSGGVRAGCVQVLIIMWVWPRETGYNENLEAIIVDHWTLVWFFFSIPSLHQFLIVLGLQVLSVFPAGFSPPSPSSEGAHTSCSVEAVCFSPSQSMGLTGSLSGVLGVWDLPTQKLRLQCVHQVWEGKGGGGSCCWWRIFLGWWRVSSCWIFKG